MRNLVEADFSAVYDPLDPSILGHVEPVLSPPLSRSKLPAATSFAVALALAAGCGVNRVATPTLDPTEVTTDGQQSIDAWAQNLIGNFLSAEQFRPMKSVDFWGGKVSFYVLGEEVETESYLSIFEAMFKAMHGQAFKYGVSFLPKDPDNLLSGRTVYVAIANKPNRCLVHSTPTTEQQLPYDVIETGYYYDCKSNANSITPEGFTADERRLYIKSAYSLIVVTTLPPNPDCGEGESLLVPDGEKVCLPFEKILQSGAGHEWGHVVLTASGRTSSDLGQLEEEEYIQAAEAIIIEDYLDIQP